MVEGTGLRRFLFRLHQRPYFKRVGDAEIPAKQNGSPSARLNHRHIMLPLGVFLSGSAKAIACTTHRCSRLSQDRHWLFLSVRKFVPQLAPGLYFGNGMPT